MSINFRMREGCDAKQVKYKIDISEAVESLICPLRFLTNGGFLHSQFFLCFVFAEKSWKKMLKTMQIPFMQYL